MSSWTRFLSSQCKLAPMKRKLTMAVHGVGHRISLLLFYQHIHLTLDCLHATPNAVYPALPVILHSQDGSCPVPVSLSLVKTLSAVLNKSICSPHASTMLKAQINVLSFARSRRSQVVLGPGLLWSNNLAQRNRLHTRAGNSGYQSPWHHHQRRRRSQDLPRFRGIRLGLWHCGCRRRVGTCERAWLVSYNVRRCPQ